jgi:hypothetical protein
MNKLVPLPLLVARLVTDGGCLSTSNDFTPEEIEEAKDEGRMAVDDSGFGYIWSDSDPFVKRLNTLHDLLRSAMAIAEREGKDTNWQAWSARLKEEGIRAVTTKTFRAFNPTPLQVHPDVLKGKIIVSVFIILIAVVAFSQALRLAAVF